MRRFIILIILIFLGSMLSAQDDCNTAIDLNNDLGPFGFCTKYYGSYNTDGLSPEPDLASMGCEYENYPTMWFVINPPPGATNMTVSITGQLADPTLGIFIENGCAPPYDQAGPFSGCNFDPAEYNLMVNDAFSYYIVVSSQSGSGLFSINLHFDDGNSSPPNDLCANAIEVFDEVPLVDQNNFCASYDNSPICDNESTVWYFVEIPEDSYQILVILSPISAGFLSVAIYDACGGDQIINPGGCLPVMLTGCLPEGNYYIEVASTVWSEGTFDIEVNISQCFPTCEITEPNIDDIICNDNGTSDPSDDYITFTLDPVGNGLGAGYDISVSSPEGVTPASAAYGSPTMFTMGPGSANGTGDFTITIVDQADENCTYTFMIPYTGPCSPECIIDDVGLANVECNDNGTPSNPFDDIIQFELFPVGTNLATMYTITASGGYSIFPNTGSYNIGTIFYLEDGSAGNGDIMITITDVDDPDCTFDFTITDPGTCSEVCDISSVVFTDIICNDNDTPTDPSDDYITYTVFVQGNNVGLEYTMVANGTNAIISSGFYETNSNGILDLGSALLGDIEITFFDLDNPSCQLMATLPNPGPCSDFCEILEANLEDIQCNDNDTESDSSDDYYVFTLNPNGSNLGLTYSVSGNGVAISPTNGIYGTSTEFFTTSGSAGSGDITISITDDNDTSCNIDVLVSDLGSCSSSCMIDSIILFSAICDDNSTPSDSTDDFLIIEFTSFGSSTSDSIIVEIIGNLDIDTFAIVDMHTIELYIDDSTPDTIDIIVSDLVEGFCRDTLTFLNPGPCSPECNIDSIQILSILCNDNETNTPDDDIIDIEFIVLGTNVGSSFTYSIMGFLDGIADYGDTISITSISSIIGISPFILTIEDTIDPLCNFTISIENPGPCSTDCTIVSSNFTNVICNDSGTNTDDSDDFISFEVFIEANNQGSSYSISINNGLYIYSNLDYDIVNTINLPAGSAQDGNYTFEIIDDDIEECMATFTLDNPGPCSTTCNLLAPSLFNILCNDNGTLSDSSDDYISFTLNVTGTNINSGYQITSNIGIVSPNSGNYGVDEDYSLDLGSAGGGNLILTIVDNDDLSCWEMIDLNDPGSCSDECDIQTADISNVMCNDAGTPFDASDDYISFDLIVSGVNLGSSFSLNNMGSTITPMIGVYNQILTFELPNGSAGNGNVEIIITDEFDSLCSLSFTVIDPGDCSSDCNFSVDAGADIELNCYTPMFELSAQFEGLPTIEWIDSEGEILSNNAEIQFTEEGIYYVHFDYGNGCVLSDSIEVNANFEEPIFELGKDTLLDCIIERIEFFAPLLQGNYSYSWFENDILVSEEANYQSENQSNLKLIIQNQENGCSYSDSLLILVDTLSPNAIIYSDPLSQIDCLIQSVTLTTANEENVIYQWAYGDEIVIADQIIVSESTEVYLVAIDTINGCDDFDNILIANNIEYPFISLSTEEIICDQEGIIINAENSQTGPTILAEWTNADGMLLAENEYNIFISTPGLYVFTLIDSINGCINSDSINIEFTGNQFPTYNINQSEISDGSIQIEIVSDSVLVGDWIVDGQVICSACQKITLSEDSNVALEIVIVDSLGCIQTEQLIIEFEKEGGIHFPNIFSPNGDGINDIFEIYGPSDTQIVSFTIYDRWGNLLHLAENKTLGDPDVFWDGFYNGKLIQSGVYVYCFTTLEASVCGTITVVQ